MYFSPCFFHNDNPEFRSISFWEFRCHRVAPFSARNMIVNNNFIFASIRVANNSVDSLFIVLIIDKQLFYSFRVLSKAGKRCEEITVSKLSLFYIIWLNFAFKKLANSFIIYQRLHTTRSNKLDVIIICCIFTFVCILCINKTFFFRWESRV